MLEQHFDIDGNEYFLQADDEFNKAWAEDSRTISILVTSSIFIALTIVAISLRFYSRWTASIKLWWDDWLALASIVSTLHRSELIITNRGARSPSP